MLSATRVFTSIFLAPAWSRATDATLSSSSERSNGVDFGRSSSPALSLEERKPLSTIVVSNSIAADARPTSSGSGTSASSSTLAPASSLLWRPPNLLPSLLPLAPVSPLVPRRRAPVLLHPPRVLSSYRGLCGVGLNEIPSVVATARSRSERTVSSAATGLWISRSTVSSRLSCNARRSSYETRSASQAARALFSQVQEH
mmetsp:Transcript_38818/g.85302  ORF Transcript_38818/g.85302 Transcript_38818/m.85302 type:complete len:200 (+) Transcript_38818:1052-1651(+)